MTEEMKSVLTDRLQEYLQTLRIKLKLTQQQLADKVGVSRYTIMQIENKQRKLTWNTFLSLMLVFIKNKETDQMLTLFKIYTDDLNKLLKTDLSK